MRALTRLSVAQARLAIRDVTSVAVVFVVPIALMLVFGSLWDDGAEVTADPRTHLSFLPAMTIGLGLLMIAVFQLPVILVDYREKRVLRWLSTTPIPPSLIMVAQVMIAITFGLKTIALLLGLGTFVGIPGPANWTGLIVALLLGMAECFAIGLLIAALAPSVTTAYGAGFIVLFPSLFLGGLWVPTDQFPAVLRRISDYAPLTMLIDPIGNAWDGAAISVAQLVVMAGIAVVSSSVALRWFRWE